jgi:hypothetical protein
MTALTRRDVVVLGALASAGRITATSAAGLPRVIDGLRNQRPRLLATPEEITALNPRLAVDELGRRWRAALLQYADRLLDTPPVDMTFEPKRPVLLPTSREVLKHTEALGLAWLLTGNHRYSDFPSWNPSHFLDVAEMTMAAALAYDWCHDACPVDAWMAAPSRTILVSAPSSLS